MKLSPEQKADFDRDGHLFFPGLFSAAEMQPMLAAVPELYSRQEPYNVREKGTQAVPTNFSAHLASEPFARLARLARMVEPVQSLLGEALYMHQFKINGKMAFEGDVWQWHQDYGTWMNDDLMPTARGMNVAIFLDDVLATLSPWNRISVYLRLCAVSNHIRRFKRPEFIAQRDFTPIDAGERAGHLERTVCRH